MKKLFLLVSVLSLFFTLHSADVNDTNVREVKIIIQKGDQCITQFYLMVDINSNYFKFRDQVLIILNKKKFLFTKIKLLGNPEAEADKVKDHLVFCENTEIIYMIFEVECKKLINNLIYL